MVEREPVEHVLDLLDAPAVRPVDEAVVDHRIGLPLDVFPPDVEWEPPAVDQV